MHIPSYLCLTKRNFDFYMLAWLVLGAMTSCQEKKEIDLIMLLNENGSTTNLMEKC